MSTAFLRSGCGGSPSVTFTKLSLGFLTLLSGVALALVVASVFYAYFGHKVFLRKQCFLVYTPYIRKVAATGSFKSRLKTRSSLALFLLFLISFLFCLRFASMATHCVANPLEEGSTVLKVQMDQKCEGEYLVYKVFCWILQAAMLILVAWFFILLKWKFANSKRTTQAAVHPQQSAGNQVSERGAETKGEQTTEQGSQAAENSDDNGGPLDFLMADVKEDRYFYPILSLFGVDILLVTANVRFGGVLMQLLGAVGTISVMLLIREAFSPYKKEGATFRASLFGVVKLSALLVLVWLMESSIDGWARYFSTAIIVSSVLLFLARYSVKYQVWGWLRDRCRRPHNEAAVEEERRRSAETVEEGTPVEMLAVDDEEEEKASPPSSSSVQSMKKGKRKEKKRDVLLTLHPMNGKGKK
jgi:hypothetical protein